MKEKDLRCVCGYKGELTTVYDIKGFKHPNAENYKGNDFSNEVRIGCNIYECPKCSRIKRIKKLHEKVVTVEKESKSNRNPKDKLPVTRDLLLDQIELLKELKGSGVTFAEIKKINNQIKRIEYYLKKESTNE